MTGGRVRPLKAATEESRAGLRGKEMSLLLDVISKQNK